MFTRWNREEIEIRDLEIEMNMILNYDEDPEAELKSNASGNSTSQTIINEQTADITATQIDDGSEKK